MKSKMKEMELKFSKERENGQESLKKKIMDNAEIRVGKKFGSVLLNCFERKKNKQTKLKRN